MWAYAEAPAGTEYAIMRYRQRNSNLRTQLLRIIDRAGVTFWPKLFHNLRASRQTELTADSPLHVVCAWIGNSASIADKHYLQVTDDHYADAVRGTESGTVNAKNGTQAAQNPAQQPAAASRTNWQETKTARQNRAILRPDAFGFDASLGNPIPPRGVEPLSSD